MSKELEKMSPFEGVCLVAGTLLLGAVASLVPAPHAKRKPFSSPLLDQPRK